MADRARAAAVCLKQQPYTHTIGQLLLQLDRSAHVCFARDCRHCFILPLTSRDGVSCDGASSGVVGAAVEDAKLKAARRRRRRGAGCRRCCRCASVHLLCQRVRGEEKRRICDNRPQTHGLVVGRPRLRDGGGGSSSSGRRLGGCGGSGSGGGSSSAAVATRCSSSGGFLLLAHGDRIDGIVAKAKERGQKKKKKKKRKGFSAVAVKENERR